MRLFQFKKTKWGVISLVRYAETPPIDRSPYSSWLSRFRRNRKSCSNPTTIREKTTDLPLMLFCPTLARVRTLWLFLSPSDFVRLGFEEHGVARNAPLGEITRATLESKQRIESWCFFQCPVSRGFLKFSQLSRLMNCHKVGPWYDLIRKVGETKLAN